LRYRQLSPSGDMTFGSGLRNFYINVPAAVGQAVQTRLQLFQGDWFLDATEGTPYISGVLGKFSQSQADAIIRDRTLNTQGLTDISEFTSSLNADARAYFVDETISTIYGVATVQAILGIGNIPVFPKLNPELITQSGFVITTQSGEAITK
jgi:hypothetical protein